MTDSDSLELDGAEELTDDDWLESELLESEWLDRLSLAELETLRETEESLEPLLSLLDESLLSLLDESLDELSIDELLLIETLIDDSLSDDEESDDDGELLAELELDGLLLDDDESLLEAMRKSSGCSRRGAGLLMS